MKKWLTLAGGVALALSSASVGAQETLRIGTEGAYPPYNATNAQGELEGFEIDLGNAICEQMGVTCEFVAQDWDGIIPALENERYDAIMAGMSITPERQERISFSQGYVTTPAWLIAAKDSDLQQAQSWEDAKAALEGRTVGVQTSTIHQNFIEEQLGDTVDLRQYDTQENLQLDLASGRIDAGLADSSAWEAWLSTEEGGNFEPFGPGLTGEEFPVFGEGVGIGVRKDDEELLARLNEALCELKRNGTVSQLSEQWFGYDIAMSPPEDVCGG